MPYKDPALRKEKQREYQRKWYANNANRVQQRRAVKICLRRRADWLTSLKTRPCADCAGVFDPVCMDWDHLPEYDKLMDISAMVRAVYSKTRILQELAKCELVCANCHRLRTKRRRLENLT